MSQPEIAFSIMMITYNHEAYIGRSIESVLMQEFDHRMELVIGIDKSSDKTLEVAQAYQKKYPQLIKLLVHDQNIGMYQNLVTTLKACTGKYIAILEGDDYWSDPMKLQLQYDFFKRHPNCVLNAGLSSTLNGNEETFKLPLFARFFKGKIFTRKEIVYSNRLTTLTTAFRRVAIRFEELEKLHSSPHLDWGVYLSLAYNTDSFIYRFNRKFGVYRMHQGGVYSMVDANKRNINFLKTVYAIASLQLSGLEQRYLQALFTNFSNRLRGHLFLETEPYKSYYNSASKIYHQNNRLSGKYISALYKKVFSKQLKDKTDIIQSEFELIRQTKPTNRIYTDIRLVPFLVIAGVIKMRGRLKKKQLLKDTY